MSTKTIKHRETPLIHHVRTAFGDPSKCDVTVTTSSGESIPCLKIVLRTSSEVFDKAFTNDMLEKETGTLHIEHVDSDAVKQMLTFLHTGSCEIDPFNILPLTSLARTYSITVLEEICKEYRAADFNVDSENCFLIYKQARNLMVADGEAAMQCIKAIRDNIDWLHSAEAFQENIKCLDMLGIDTLISCALPTYFARNFPKNYISLIKLVVDWLGVTSEEVDVGKVLSKLEFRVVGFAGLQELSETVLAPLVAIRPELGNLLLGAFNKTMVLGNSFTKMSMGCQVLSSSASPFGNQHDVTEEVWCVPRSGLYTIVCRTGKEILVGTFHLVQNTNIIGFSKKSTQSGLMFGGDQKAMSDLSAGVGIVCGTAKTPGALLHLLMFLKVSAPGATCPVPVSMRKPIYVPVNSPPLVSASSLPNELSASASVPTTLPSNPGGASKAGGGTCSCGFSGKLVARGSQFNDHGLSTHTSPEGSLHVKSSWGSSQKDRFTVIPRGR